MIKINLVSVYVPKDRLLVEKQFASLASLLIVSIVLSLLWFFSVSSQKAEVGQLLAVEKTELKRLELVQKRIDDFQKKKKRREEILEAIKKLQSRRVGPYPFLDDLNIMLPPDIWLTKITENNLAIGVSGFTFSNTAVADLMRSMEASEHFSKVELTEIQQSKVKNEAVKRFTITSAWNIERETEEEKKKKEMEKGKKTANKK